MGIFDKIKKSLLETKEDKIQSDPELKALKKKIDKRAKKLENQSDDAMRKMGIK